MTARGSQIWTVSNQNYRFQDQWGGGGRRLNIVLAFFFGGLGGGAYLVSAWQGFAAGALAGLGIVAIGKSITHLLFLGKPQRFWRAPKRLHQSWISRGVVVFTLFALSGLGYHLVGPAHALGTPLRWLSMVCAFLTILYSGLLLNQTAIPLWRHRLVPVLFVVTSLASGANLSAFVARVLGQAGVNLPLFEQLAFWGAMLMLVLMALFLRRAFVSDPASRQSVRWLLASKQGGWYFYGLFLAVGLLFPILAHVFDLIARVDEAILILAYLGESLLGGYVFRFLILRGGVFRALIP